MNPELEIVSSRILSALFNGACQGLLLTGLVWLGLKVVPRSNAATRHAVLFVTLLVVALLPVGHFWSAGPAGARAARIAEFPPTRQTPPDREEPTALMSSVARRGEFRRTEESGSVGRTTRPGASDAGTSSFTEPPGAWIVADPAAVLGRQTLGAERLFEDSARAAAAAHDTPRPVTAARLRADAGSAPLAAASVAADGAAGIFPAPDAVASQSALERTSKPRAFAQQLLRADLLRGVPIGWEVSLPPSLAPVLAGGWLVLALARLAALLRQCRLLGALKRRGLSAPGPLATRFRALHEEMRVRRRARLLVCQELAVPMMVGFARPAVLLPARFLQQPADDSVEQVLRHELAHVRRRDDWASLVQQAVKAVLFFHPAVWWLGRRLTVEREIACDDHVLAAGRPPRDYALFLTEFASDVRSRDWAPALAAWSNTSQLNERVTMILNSKRNTSPHLARATVGFLTTAAALTAVIGLQAAPRVSIAASADRAEGKATTVSAQSEPEIATSVTAEVQTHAQGEAVAELKSPDGTLTLKRTATFAVDAEPATASATVDSGPKPKPAQTPAALSLPAASPVGAPRPMAAPAPAQVPPRALAAANAAPPLAAPPAPSPGPPIAGPPPGIPGSPPLAKPRRVADNASLERRLERLERMVESLLEQQKAHKETREAFSDEFDIQLKGPDWNQSFDDAKWRAWEDKWKEYGEHFAELAEKFSESGLKEDLARIQQEAARAAELATRALERAVREAEQAKNQALLRLRADNREAGKQTLERQRQLLESQRRALEEQIQALDRQLEHLEEQQDRLRQEEAEPSPREPSNPAARQPEPPDRTDTPGPKRKL